MTLPNPLCAVLWSALFLPERLLGGWPVRAFPALVCFLGAWTLLTKPSPWETRQPAREAVLVFLWLQAFYVTSYAYSSAFNGIRTGFRDLLDLPRYALAAVSAAYLIRHFDVQVRKSLDAALAAVLYASLLAVAVGSRSLSLFADSDHVGYVMTLTFLYFLFFSCDRLRFAHAAAALPVVFLTGSRAAWSASAFVLSLYLAALLYQRLRRSRAKDHAAALSAAFFVAWAGALVFGGWIKLGAAASAVEAMTYIRQSPLFGWGPAAYEPMSSLGNQYQRWLLRGGALGSATLLLGLVLVVFRLLRAVHGHWRLRLGAVAFLGAVALMLGSGPFLEDFRLMSLTAFLVAGIHEDAR
ncbi:MAG: hypothetical protein HYZ74_08830 [Elusimicrobia bacterium]|nr:hypothetical protein [Elusimicrobiota bacterium]